MADLQKELQAILKHITPYLGGAQLAKADINLGEFALLINLLNCLILFLLSFDTDFASFVACIVPSCGQRAHNTHLLQKLARQ